MRPEMSLGSLATVADPFGSVGVILYWLAVIEVRRLATFRRKIGGFMNFDQRRDTKRSPSEWPTGSAGRKIAGADLWA